MEYTPQTPAEGISQQKEWTDMKSYKIPCSCSCDNDVTMMIEVNDFNIVTNFYATTKTKYWYRRLDIDYNENWLLLNFKLLFNDWYNRFDVAWKALTKGYVETQSDVILSPQQAVNFAETLKTAVKDYEVLVEARKAGFEANKAKNAEAKKDI